MRFSAAGGEQGLAVAAAEQEDEPFQIGLQVQDSVGGVTGELFQGGGQACPWL